MAIVGFAILLCAAPRSAKAWDGPNLWFDDAAGATPGGGGILATGGVQDHNITCAHCHTKAQNLIDLKLAFTPPLPTVGGQTTYEPGQKYQVDVKLTGEHLGLSNCVQGQSNLNHFVATFEDGDGNVVGSLASDSGQSSAACPPTAPTMPSGTTLTFGDCRAVFSSGKTQTAWTFTWTAPPKMSGPVMVHYGAVDGDCDMTSMNDDVTVGTMKLLEATAMGPSEPGGGKMAQARRNRLADATGLVGLLPVGIVLAARRRRMRA
jgi:hypothetical protein